MSSLHRGEAQVVGDIVVQSNSVDGLKAFNKKNGSLLWSFPVKGGVVGGVTVHSERVYFAGSDGFFYSLKLHSAKLVWQFPINFEGIGKPLVTAGRVYFQSGNNTVFALDSASGDLVWKYVRKVASNLSVRGTGQPTLKDNKLYVGFSDGNLVVLNALSGQATVEKRISPGRKFNDVDAKVLVTAKRIYVVTFDGKLYVLTLGGKTLWTVDGGSDVTPTIEGGVIYLSASQGKVKALDEESGKEIWSFNVEGTPTGVSVFKNRVLFGGSNGPLYVLDQKTGKLLARYHTGRGIASKPVVDKATGSIYFSTVSSNLHAVKVLSKKTEPFYSWEK